MKQLFSIAVFLLACFVVNAQAANPKYDSALALKLGADPYGMRNYVFVILKSGDNKSTDMRFRDSCFAGHLQNIKRLAAARKIIVAGPFGENNSDFRGLFILNVPTIEAAKQLLQTDPAIHAGFLAPELYPWYGSAALPEYLDASDKVWKTGF